MKKFVTKLSRYGLVPLLAVLGACGGGDEYEGFSSEIGSATPNQFLTFFNRQRDLASGQYLLIAATGTAGQAGSFSVDLQRHDGSAEQVTGSWVSSGGLDADSTCASGNVCIPLNLNGARKISITLNTALDGVLYLVENNGTPTLVASANDNGAGIPEQLEFSESEIDETDFATAYYDAIDPGGARATAQAYWSLHQFDAPAPDVHVIFRDSKDLGYGRDMYLSVYSNASVGSTCGPPGAVTIAFFVRNFSVEIVDGFAYGPVNLEAAIAEDLQHHVGTNAIEFGYGRDDVGDSCSAEPMARFYTYEPRYNPPNAAHPLRTRVDLDARGEKAMPQPCISCHGGKLRPLDRFGRFVAMHANDAQAQIGDTKARMQAFEVDTFEFSDEVGHRRVDYEEGLRLLNSAIYCTYPGSAGHAACASFGGGVPAAVDIGEWSGDFAREMMLGWYANALETPGSRYDQNFVPVGWRPSLVPPLVPVGAGTLFKKVVGPNCFVCHGKRGNELGSDSNASGEGKDVDFSTWDKFISHADEIERLVFDEGKMPLGLLNYQNFWEDPEKAELLASFIAPYVTDSAGFSARRLDGSGNIILPGRAVARAGPDRVTRPNAPITLNAQASLFTDLYRWRITASPPGSVASLSAAAQVQTDFVADLPGEYTLELLASSSETGSSQGDSLIVVVDNALATAPRDLDFYTDIEPRLATCAATCHSNGVQAGVPVWWVADGAQPLGVPATTADPPSLGLYEQVMARVNLDFAEDSLIVKKPSGIHHFGGQQTGFDLSTGVGSAARADYDRFVNWISEGVACGGTAAECVR